MAMGGGTVPRAKPGRWIGFITTAQAAGFALGPGIGGFLYQAWGFSSPFLISAAIAFIASLLALVMLPETLSEHVREQVRLRRVNKRQDEKGSNAASPRVSSVLWAFMPPLIVYSAITFFYPFFSPHNPFF